MALKVMLLCLLCIGGIHPGAKRHSNDAIDYLKDGLDQQQDWDSSQGETQELECVCAHGCQNGGAGGGAKQTGNVGKQIIAGDITVPIGFRQVDIDQIVGGQNGAHAEQVLCQPHNGHQPNEVFVADEGIDDVGRGSNDQGNCQSQESAPFVHHFGPEGGSQRNINTKQNIDDIDI